MNNELRLENRHTGEVLHIRRVRDGDQVILELDGCLPPKGDGPPLHIHLMEREEGEVVAGVLGAVIDGVTAQLQPGQKAVMPVGSKHRWWNAGDQLLRFKGRAFPAVDLDRYLQALFAVANAGSSGRPPLFYLSHVVYRHGRTQRLANMPLAVQRVLFPTVVFVGWLLGKYRGDRWPGAPASCPGALEERTVERPPGSGQSGTDFDPGVAVQP